MHSKTGKARGSKHYDKKGFCCNRCVYTRKYGCAVGKLMWPTAGRRCKHYRLSWQLGDDT